LKTRFIVINYFKQIRNIDIREVVQYTLHKDSDGLQKS
jgi:hypothetical protein